MHTLSYKYCHAEPDSSSIDCCHAELDSASLVQGDSGSGPEWHRGSHAELVSASLIQWSHAAASRLIPRGINSKMSISPKSPAFNQENTNYYSKDVKKSMYKFFKFEFSITVKCRFWFGKHKIPKKVAFYNKKFKKSFDAYRKLWYR